MRQRQGSLYFKSGAGGTTLALRRITFLITTGRLITLTGSSTGGGEKDCGFFSNLGSGGGVANIFGGSIAREGTFLRIGLRI